MFVNFRAIDKACILGVVLTVTAFFAFAIIRAINTIAIRNDIRLFRNILEFHGHFGIVT